MGNGSTVATKKAEGVVSPIVRRALDIASGHIIEIILFGSVQRGDQHEHSDIDVLLLTDGGLTDVQSSEFVSLRTSAGRPRVDARAMSIMDAKATLSRGNTVVRDALREGRVLWPHPGPSHYRELALTWSPMAGASQWLKRAGTDLAVATVSLGIEAWNDCAYHAQQLRRRR